MSLSTPIPAVQALQLDDKGLSATSHRAELPDPESRKRRRITPTNFIPVSSVGPSQARDGIGSGKHIGASSAQPKPWDFLAKWEAEDSSIVEDIEGEEYYSDVSGGSPDALEDVDHENEGEEDVLPEVSAIRLGKVRPDRVVDIINGCIEKYAAAWKPGKGETKHKSEKCQGEVPVVYDANALWEQAHAAGEREELAEKYELEAEYYRQRLDKLCDEITKDPSDTEAAVKMVRILKLL
ncbi:hypothetical protein N0V86_005281 [Didymella sp. IMI 355093]|nr:hypothetical protein N0V86_005281 [Didymella sp. IMI 355093]